MILETIAAVVAIGSAAAGSIEWLRRRHHTNKKGREDRERDIERQQRLVKLLRETEESHRRLGKKKLEFHAGYPAMSPDRRNDLISDWTRTAREFKERVESCSALIEDLRVTAANSDATDDLLALKVAFRREVEQTLRHAAITPFDDIPIINWEELITLLSVEGSHLGGKSGGKIQN